MEKQEGSMKVNPKSTRKCSCCTILIVTVSMAVCFVAVIVGTLLYERQQEFEMPSNVVDTIGMEGVQAFMSHDINSDGYLSIQEFVPLFMQIIGSGANISSNAFNYEQPIEDGEEVVTVTAHFQELNLSTMTTEMEPEWSVMNGQDSLSALRGLRGWNKVHLPKMNFAVNHFNSFLPQDTTHLQQLGSVYPIVEIKESVIDSLTFGHQSSNRYYPPKVSDNMVIVHRLLNMFHPRPFIVSRFAPKGSVACVRAYNEKYVDIVFRIHAEFQLNEPPFLPFWFTPAQFTGNLIMSRDATSMLHFNLYVPSNRSLNVDMEWLKGGDNMEVDIGYMPEMRLTITAPSDVPHPELKQEAIPPSADGKTSSIRWQEEISMEDALRQLEVKMLPFKKVKYYDFSDVFKEAELTGKLVHSVLLWGALDDQSC